MFAQFKKFLGHSVTEIVRQAQELEENPERRIPFKQIQQKYSGLNARDSMSDTQALQLQEATLTFHRAVARRHQAGFSEAQVDQLQDSYTLILDHPINDRVFSQWGSLHSNLRSDLEDLRRARSLPYESQDPAERFIDAADTVHRILNNYASRFSVNARCQSLAGLDCSQIYGPSVDVVSLYLQRYAGSWPGFNLRPVDQPNELRTMLDELMEVSNLLRNRFPRDYQAEPWSNRDSFLRTFKEFNRRFHETLRSWYGSILREFQVHPRQLDPALTSGRRDQLEDLLALQVELKNHPTARQVLIQEPAAENHKIFLNSLHSTYLWLQVRSEYGPEIEPDERDRQLLHDLILAEPDGDRILAEINNQTQTIRNIYNTLEQALGNRNYDTMVRILERLHNREMDEERGGPAREAWKLAVRDFLEQSRQKVIQPSWQPRSTEGQELYTQLINLYGKISLKHEFDLVDSQWVNQTLMAMRNRRFNQLRHESRQIMQNLSEQNRGELVNSLEQIFQIEDLPEELQNQAHWLVLEAALLERLQLQSSNIRETIQTPFQNNNRIAQFWSDGVELARLLEQPPSEERLRDYIQSVIDRVREWYRELQQPLATTRRLDQALVEKARALFGRYSTWTIERIRQTETLSSDNVPSLEQVSGLMEIRQNVQSASPFKELEYAHDLTPWRNLLKLRKHLLLVRDSIDSMDRGGVFSGNDNYDQFSNSLNQGLGTPLPGDYDFAPERKLLDPIHKAILSHARAFQRKAKEQWFGSLGGRLTGTDLLQPWASFLNNWRQAVTHNQTRAVLASRESEANQQLEEWN